MPKNPSRVSILPVLLVLPFCTGGPLGSPQPARGEPPGGGGASSEEVRLDAGKELGPSKLRFGFLCSDTTLAAFPRSVYEPLRVRYWRTGIEDLREFRTSGPAPDYNATLSGLWCRHRVCQSLGRAAHKQNLMWNHMDEWERFVFDTVRSARTSGPRIRYWEPMNEPFISWGGGHEPRKIYDTYHAAYRAIKRADPDAWVGGPTLVSYDRARIEEFLADVKRAGTGVDFLVWHELHDRMFEVPGHVEEIRSIVARRFPDLGIKEFHVNEIINKQATYSPSTLLAAVAALEKAGVDVGAKACWGAFDCGFLLDGLLAASPRGSKQAAQRAFAEMKKMAEECGRNPNCNIEAVTQATDAKQQELISEHLDLKPRPVWWVFRAYAEMQDGIRLAAEGSDRALVALANRDQDGRVIDVLVGNYAPAGRASSPRSPRLRIVNLPAELAGKAVSVEIEKIPGTAEALPQGPAKISKKVMEPAGGTLDIDLGRISKDEVVAVRIEPSTSSEARP